MIPIDALNALGAAWAGFMTRALIDVSVLLALVLVVWLPLRRRVSAQFAHGLFLLVLLKLVVPLPATWSWSLPRPVPRGAEHVSAWEPPAAPFPLPTTGDLGAGPSDAPPPALLAEAKPSAQGPKPPAARAALSVQTGLMLGWGALTLLLLARLLRAYVATRRLIREAAPLGPDWLPIDLDALSRRAGVRAQVRWAVSPRLSAPAVGGLARPTVVLPPDLDDDLTPRQLSWVLLHELAHVRRGDLWVVLAQRAAQAVFFFHPAVHVANWIIDQLREYACDDVALAASKNSRHDCGEGFLTVVGRSVERPPVGAAALGLFESRMLIRRRLLRILDKRRKVHERLSPRAAFGLLALALVVLPAGRPHVASARPQTPAVAPAVGRAAPVEPVSYRPGAVWNRSAAQGRGVMLALAYSPDGTLVASAGDDGAIVLRAAATGLTTARLAGHGDAVSCVAFAPDGRTLATGSYDHTIKLWDVASGRERATLAGHRNWVFALAFAPDGATLASGGHDRTVRLWDVALGRALEVLSGHSGSVRAVAFSPDGTRLATGGADRVVRVWDWRSATILAKFEPHSGTVRALAFAPGGRALASGGEDGEARLWDASSGRRLTTLAGHSDMVTCLAFTPEGGTLATGSLDTTVKLWDWRAARERATLQGHTDGVSALAFAPEARQLASCGFDGTVRLWEPAAPVFSPSACLTFPGEPRAVAYTADGRVLLAAGRGGVARWDARTGLAQEPAASAHANALATAPDGTTYALGDEDGNLRLCEAASGRVLATFAGQGAAIRSVTYSPDGRLLASGDQAGSVRLWDVRRRSALGPLPKSKAFDPLPGERVGNSQQINPSPNPIACVRFAPDGRTLAAAGGGEVVIWDVASRGGVGTLGSHAHAVAFAPDGTQIATAGADGLVTIWDAATRSPRQTLQYAECRAVAFAPDGRFLASAHQGGDVILWDVRSGRQAGLLKGHAGLVHDLAFAPDGRSLATAGKDGSVKLWDLGARRLTARATLKGDLTPVWSAAYSPDGRTLAVADGAPDTPGSVTLWDLATRKVTATLEGHEQGVSSVAFAPDGRTLASGGWDGSILLWDVARKEPVRRISGLRGVTDLAFAPDGKTLASAGQEPVVHLWDVETGEEVNRLTGFRSPVQCVAYSPDGRLLATGGGDFASKPGARGEVKLWDVETGTEIAALDGHARAVLALAFSPDGATLASGGLDQSARLWDVASRRSRLTLGGLPSCVQALAFSRDGRVLAWSGRGDGLVALHDVRDGAGIARLVGHGAVVRALAFAPDGRGLATGGADRTIKLWDVAEY